MNTITINAAAFFYIDGVPTKGTWVDLDESTTWDDIAAAIEGKGKRFGHEATPIGGKRSL